MIFRWSIWGEDKSSSIELLSYSICSFRKQFGPEHRYIVFTDDADCLTRNLKAKAEIAPYPGNSIFNISSKATWRKWSPRVRLNLEQHEFFIDSDVFLVRYPMEVVEALSSSQTKFAILDEFVGKPFQHGAMRQRASDDTPFANAGFFLQKSGFDITNNLLSEFQWWNENVPANEQTHHDEQGALAVALTDYVQRGEVQILPKDKYMLISETSNPDVQSLDGVTLFHATYPTHPAFYKFRHELDEILGSDGPISS